MPAIDPAGTALGIPAPRLPTGGFTVPWTYTNWDGSPGGEMHEYLCQDNERDYSKLR